MSEPKSGVKLPSEGGKVRLISMEDLDHRRTASKAAVTTKNSIIADLGGEDRLSTVERLLAEHCALAAAVVQDSYARWIDGQKVPLTELATVQNSFLRIASLLGLSRRPRDV